MALALSTYPSLVKMVLEGAKRPFSLALGWGTWRCGQAEMCAASRLRG